MNNTPATDYPEGEDGGRYVRGRQRSGMIWSFVFFGATMIGIVVLTALLFNVANAAFGFVLMKDKVQAATLAVGGVPLAELPKEALVEILQKKVSKGVVRRLESEKPLAERDRGELYDLVLARVVEPEMVKSWSLLDSLTKRAAIRAEADALPNARLEFRSWLTLAFITSPQSSNAELAGVRTAILGSLWTILVTILFALPVGVGAAIYLEEYAPDTTFNRLIQTNISNLAGVPSIIYGMLGLAVFVRMLEAHHERQAVRRGHRSDHGQRPHDHLSRAHTRSADPAADHPQRPGGGTDGAAVVAPGELRHRGHPVADDLASRSARRHPRHPHRDDPGGVARHRRDRAAGGDRRIDVHRPGSVGPVLEVYHLADPDLSMDRAAAGGVSQPGRRGDPGAVGPVDNLECHRGDPAQPLCSECLMLTMNQSRTLRPAHRVVRPTGANMPSRRQN